MSTPHASTTKLSGNRFASATNGMKAMVKHASWHRNVPRVKIARKIRSAMMACAFARRDSRGIFPICKLSLVCVLGIGIMSKPWFAAACQVDSVAELIVPKMLSANGTMSKVFRSACAQRDMPAMEFNSASVYHHPAMFGIIAD